MIPVSDNSEKRQQPQAQSPLDPLTMQLVIGWIEAEKEAGNFAGLEVTDLTPMAIDRVRLVLGGEVRWSETTPGDRAIWKGRARDVAKFDRRWRNRDKDADQLTTEERNIARRNRRTGATSDRRYLNVWDTVLVEDGDGGPGFTTYTGGSPVQSLRLFGNANVGRLDLTNLQVGSMIAGDSPAYIATMYASATDWDGLVGIADRCFVTLVIGSRPMVQAPLRELVHGVPVRQTIPPRQDFNVQLDMFVKHGLPRRRFDPFELVIHLEGVSSYVRYTSARLGRSRVGVEDVDITDYLPPPFDVPPGAPAPDPATFAGLPSLLPRDLDLDTLTQRCAQLLSDGNYCGQPLGQCPVHDQQP